MVASRQPPLISRGVSMKPMCLFKTPCPTWTWSEGRVVGDGQRRVISVSGTFLRSRKGNPSERLETAIGGGGVKR